MHTHTHTHTNYLVSHFYIDHILKYDFGYTPCATKNLAFSRHLWEITSVRPDRASSSRRGRAQSLALAGSRPYHKDHPRDLGWGLGAEWHLSTWTLPLAMWAAGRSSLHREVPVKTDALAGDPVRSMTRGQKSLTPRGRPQGCLCPAQLYDVAGFSLRKSTTSLE